MARAMPRSAPGSVRVIPPVMFRNTSLSARVRLRCLLRMAQINCRRAVVMPLAVRCGMGRLVVVTRA